MDIGKKWMRILNLIAVNVDRASVLKRVTTHENKHLNDPRITLAQL